MAWMRTLHNTAHKSLAIDETNTRNHPADSQPDSRQTKRGNIVVLPWGADLSVHRHVITSSIFGATSETSAARLQLIIFHLLVSHNKLWAIYRWIVSRVVTIVFCLVSEEAATITNNHGLTADDFQQICVVAHVDSTFN